MILIFSVIRCLISLQDSWIFLAPQETLLLWNLESPPRSTCAWSSLRKCSIPGGYGLSPGIILTFLLSNLNSYICWDGNNSDNQHTGWGRDSDEPPLQKTELSLSDLIPYPYASCEILVLHYTLKQLKQKDLFQGCMIHLDIWSLLENSVSPTV